MIVENEFDFILGEICDVRTMSRIRDVIVPARTEFKFIGFDVCNVVLSCDKYPEDVNRDGYRGVIPDNDKITVSVDVFNKFFTEYVGDL